MRHCAPDNFACLFDTFAASLGASPMAAAIALGFAFFGSILTASLFHKRDNSK